MEKNKKIIFIVAGVVVVLIIVISLVFALGGKGDKKESTVKTDFTALSEKQCAGGLCTKGVTIDYDKDVSVLNVELFNDSKKDVKTGYVKITLKKDKDKSVQYIYYGDIKKGDSNLIAHQFINKDKKYTSYLIENATEEEVNKNVNK